MPGLHINGAWLCLEYSKHPSRDGRTRYHWQLLLPNGREFNGHDLQSGCQGGDLQEGFTCLLMILGAAADAYRASMQDRHSEDEDMFPNEVNEWAYQNDSDLQAFAYDLDEADTTRTILIDES